MPLITPIIQWLEHTFKTDVRYALRGGFFLTLSQVTSAVAALALTVAFANLLPVETYGTYRYVLAVYGLLAIASMPGVDTAVLQSVSRGYDSALKTGISTKLRWSLIGTLASFVYAAYHYVNGSLVMGHIFIVVGLALPLMESYSLYISFLNAKKLFRTWVGWDIATQAFSVLALIGAMVATKNIVALVVAYFVPYILMRLLATRSVQRRYATEFVGDPGLLQYGRSMTLIQVVTRIMASADQIVLYHVLGPAQVAIYSLAMAVPNRIQSVFRSSGLLAFPKFANRTDAEVAQSLPRKMLLFALGIIIICVLYVLLAPFVFSAIFPKYLPSLVYSQVAVFFTISAMTYPFSSYLLAHKKVKENYWLAITSFITKVACLAILVPLFGIWGAIIGILAAAAVNIVLSLLILLRTPRAATITS